MGSLSHQLTNATLGREAPKLIQMLPRGLGGEDSTFKNYDSRLQWDGRLKGTGKPLRSIVNLTNGSVRGIKPCKGNPSNGVMGTRLLRQEPSLASDSMVVPQGFAKSQQKGLAYLPQKPLNVAPQMQKQIFNVTQFAKNSAPPFIPTKA